MISNTVIVLLVLFVLMQFTVSAVTPIVWITTLMIALLFDWFNICMTLNKDKRESEL